MVINQTNYVSVFVARSEEGCQVISTGQPCTSSSQALELPVTGIVASPKSSGHFSPIDGHSSSSSSAASASFDLLNDLSYHDVSFELQPSGLPTIPECPSRSSNSSEVLPEGGHASESQADDVCVDQTVKSLAEVVGMVGLEEPGVSSEGAECVGATVDVKTEPSECNGSI